MKVFFDTIGCRLNQSEIERMAHEFRSASHEITGNPAEADLIIINTCSVTAKAASDSRQKIRQASRLAPNASIVATGCWVTLEPKEAEKLIENIKIVLNGEKEGIPAGILGSNKTAGGPASPGRVSLPGTRHRTRAFIKVQDGCDAFCTFCVTRLARGKSRSEPVDRILADIHSAIAGGVKEIVLSGVQLGSWGRHFSPASSLRDLIKIILKETDIPRIRLSSIEPWDIDPGFFGLFEDRRICRHLHIAIQSGCAETIKRMGRRTAPTEFSQILQTARLVDPLFSISTDVITGFPGETQEEFAESLEFVRTASFSSGHVFPYSSRNGTAAADLPDQVLSKERKYRAAKMRDELAQTSQHFRQKLLGETGQVLWETVRPDTNGYRLEGFNEGFIRVSAISPVKLVNVISPVIITGMTETGLLAKIIDKK